MTQHYKMIQKTQQYKQHSKHTQQRTMLQKTQKYRQHTQKYRQQHKNIDNNTKV